MDRTNPVPSFLYRAPCGGTVGLYLVLVYPQLGHGACFDANAVPQLPQNPPPPDCLLCGAPHEAHVTEPVEIIAPQLVQVLTTN